MTGDGDDGTGAGPLSELAARVQRRAPDRLGAMLSAGTAVRVEETDTPSWLVTPDELSVIRYDSDLTTARSVVTGSRGTDGTYVIDADEPFRQVDLALTGADLFETATVTVEFRTTAGETEVRRSSIDLAGEFAPGERYEVSLAAGEPSTRAEVSVTHDGEPTETKSLGSGVRRAVLNRLGGRDFVPKERVRTGLPAPRFGGEKPPVILVSVDTLRHDHRDAMGPLLDAMGEDVVVPEEPRTQGHWTAPAHGSMFTGVHPGDHTYVGSHRGNQSPMHPGLPTVTSLLAEAGYKCSSLASHTRLAAEYGFGRGTFRHELHNMGNWLTRENDAQDNVNRLARWIERDAGGEDRLFYFLHVFDPHLPYIPPLPDPGVQADDLGLAEIRDYREQTKVPDNDYVRLAEQSVDVDPEVLDRLRTYYRRSVRYTAAQLSRLVETLQSAGLYDDALVIVTGDHGEEFGERGFYQHTSLYDGNIRSFMAVKPPADAAWSVPDEVDVIDILPTVATAAGVDPPEHCQGLPMQAAPDRRSGRPRITERIGQHWYVVAVEVDGVKGILRYEGNHPGRPTADQVEAGLVAEEYVRMSDVRAGAPEQAGDDVDQTLVETIREEATEFLRRTPVADQATAGTAVRPTAETEERLEHLGYR